jgi:predicted GTPase
MSAKKEAKKQVLEKIKSKLNTDEESVSSMSDDEEINQIVKKQKKPIVIVNKIDGRTSKKQLPPQNISGAYFV